MPAGLPSEHYTQPFPIGCALPGDHCHISQNYALQCTLACTSCPTMSSFSFPSRLPLVFGDWAPLRMLPSGCKQLAGCYSSWLLSSSSAWTSSASLSHTYPPIPKLFPKLQGGLYFFFFSGCSKPLVGVIPREGVCLARAFQTPSFLCALEEIGEGTLELTDTLAP